MKKLIAFFLILAVLFLFGRWYIRGHPEIREEFEAYKNAAKENFQELKEKISILESVLTETTKGTEETERSEFE